MLKQRKIFIGLFIGGVFGLIIASAGYFMFDYCDISPIEGTINHNKEICAIFSSTDKSIISQIVAVLSLAFMIFSLPGILLSALFGSTLFFPLFSFLFYLALGGLINKIINELFYSNETFKK